MTLQIFVSHPNSMAFSFSLQKLIVSKVVVDSYDDETRHSLSDNSITGNNLLVAIHFSALFAAALSLFYTWLLSEEKNGGKTFDWARCHCSVPGRDSFPWTGVLRRGCVSALQATSPGVAVSRPARKQVAPLALFGASIRPRLPRRLAVLIWLDSVTWQSSAYCVFVRIDKVRTAKAHILPNTTTWKWRSGLPAEQQQRRRAT